MENRFKGALIGFAVGDAMGATTEFMNEQEIRSKHGIVNDIIGGGWLNLEAGEITDDTEMTLALAKGILHNPEDPRGSIFQEFLNWKNSNPKDIGNTTLLSLAAYDGNWHEAVLDSHNQTGQSAGNGTLMRCLPIVLAYKDKNKIIDLSIDQSKMTHFDSDAAEACIINNLIAYRLLNGEDLIDSIRKEVEGTRYSFIMSADPNFKPSGYVYHTFSWVLRVLYTSNNYCEVIERLVNMGGDADTTAAIAGGLYGIYCGYDNIPSRLVDKIKIKNEILDISKKLYSLYIQS